MSPALAGGVLSVSLQLFAAAFILAVLSLILCAVTLKRIPRGVPMGLSVTIAAYASIALIAVLILVPLSFVVVAHTASVYPFDWVTGLA
jgi:hypothetical protein